MANNYRPGDWFVICDRSGFKVRASECRKTWDGLFVHKSHFEPRHPQDFVRGIRDSQRVPISRPRGEDRFLTTNQVQPEDL